MMLSTFRVVSVLEGLSWLALLCIAMPLKYYFLIPEAVAMVGPIHGALFIFYIAVLLPVSHKLQWSTTLFFFAFAAAFTPFAFLALDYYLRKYKTEGSEPLA